MFGRVLGTHIKGLQQIWASNGSIHLSFLELKLLTSYSTNLFQPNVTHSALETKSVTCDENFKLWAACLESEKLYLENI